MKKIFPDKIINIENTDIFDQKFLFDYLEFDYESNPDVEVLYMSDLFVLKDVSIIAVIPHDVANIIKSSLTTPVIFGM